MTNIECIRVNIETRRVSGGGTDGDVYLGFAGREFSLDTSADDFESGSAREYVLGVDATVKHADTNDPQVPQLGTDHVESFPVYIRFAPTGREDNWALQRATVTYNNLLFPMWDTAEHLSPKTGIWLGTHSGLVAHLLLHRG
ncbi:MAG: sle [Humibacillus sp.]|nr:sle [Humibacillus sp.]